MCKKLRFNICNRNVREIGGAFLIHAPVQRIHHARHAGADGTVPVNVAAVPRAVHKAGIYRLRHLPERKGCGVGAKAVAAVPALPGLHPSRLFQPRQHPADAGGVGADVLRQRFGIDTIPTLMLFKNGEVIGSIVAPASKAAIETFIREMLAQ